jgi:hypothetical protein
MDEIIDQMQRKADDLMSDEQFWYKLREVILLLVGIYIFDVIIVAISPFIIPIHWLSIFMGYSGWIGQIIFGLIIYSKLSQQKNAVAICLLSVMLPVFGGLFYLMAITLTQTDQ